MSNRRRIGFLIAFFAIADLLVSTFTNVSGGSIAVGPLIAFAVAQISMLAVWSSLGKKNWLLRFGVGLPAACVASLSIVRSLDTHDSFEVALMVVGVWLVLVTVLSAVRVWWGWRFTFPDNDEPRSQNEISAEKQFRIRQLFIVTTIIAVVLAIVRVLVATNDLSGNELHLLAIVGLFISVGATVVIWALLCETWLIWWIAAAIFTAGWTAGEVLLFIAITPVGPTWIIVMLNVCQFVAVSIGMACLRLAGGRLRRVNE